MLINGAYFPGSMGTQFTPAQGTGWYGANAARREMLGKEHVRQEKSDLEEEVKPTDELMSIRFLNPGKRLVRQRLSRLSKRYETDLFEYTRQRMANARKQESSSGNEQAETLNFKGFMSLMEIYSSPSSVFDGITRHGQPLESANGNEKLFLDGILKEQQKAQRVFNALDDLDGVRSGEIGVGETAALFRLCDGIRETLGATFPQFLNDQSWKILSRDIREIAQRVTPSSPEAFDDYTHLELDGQQTDLERRLTDLVFDNLHFEPTYLTQLFQPMAALNLPKRFSTWRQSHPILKPTVTTATNVLAQDE